MSTKINSSDGEADVDVEQLDLIGDACARSILTAASTGPRTAKELTAKTESSAATVYRRINSLLDTELLEETVRFDDDGSHTTAYETAIEEVRVNISVDGIDVNITSID
ncbi:MAG: DNA-binding protein [Natrialbaceae archaeon]|nr:DNA-binding protein [Natrialbaceae archaeon]